jgi:hypothetical protein
LDISLPSQPALPTTGLPTAKLATTEAEGQPPSKKPKCDSPPRDSPMPLPILQGLKVADLRDMCFREGIAHDGTKPTLMARLSAHHSTKF